MKMAIKMLKYALDMPIKMSEHAHEIAMKMHKDARLGEEPISTMHYI